MRERVKKKVENHLRNEYIYLSSCQTVQERRSNYSILFQEESSWVGKAAAVRYNEPRSRAGGYLFVVISSSVIKINSSAM